MLVSEALRRHHVVGVRSQRWLPFKVVSVIAIASLFAYYRHGYRDEPFKIIGGWPSYMLEDAAPVASSSHAELARQVALLRPLIGTMDEEDSVKRWNEESLDHLEACAAGAGCEPNWDKVTVLNSWHFSNSKNGGVSGEDIWANSTIQAFEYGGYTLLWAVKPENVLTVHLHLGNWIRAIIWEGAELQTCIDDKIPTIVFQPETLETGLMEPSMPTRCMRRPDSPDGIPVWKSFVFHFWGDPQSPLGRNWTLAPYDYHKWSPDSDNFYLGYSIENRCTSYKPPVELHDRVILLGKHEEYFTREDMPWKTLLGPVADAVAKEQDIDFQFAAAMEEKGEGFNETVQLLGLQSQEGYMAEIAASMAMLGVGLPFLSPSPFEALCLGTPFINPIMNWDRNNPWDKTQWYTQNDALTPLGPPHVYHVHAGNATGLVHAIGEARKNPIPSFIPEDMKFLATVERHKRIMEFDWQWYAEDIILDTYPDGDFEYLL